MSRPTCRLALTALSVALVLTGCGSSGTSSSSATGTKETATISKATFIAEADKICRTGDEAMAPLAKQLAPAVDSGNVKKVTALLATAAANERSGSAQLRALPEPAGSGAELAKIWGALATEITAAQKLASAFSHPSSTVLQKDEQAASVAQARYRSLSQSFGFRYCGADK